MTASSLNIPNRRHPASRGFTLVEMMVAMAIALFLIGGMLVVLQNTRSTYQTQNQLAQLEDNERLAMTLITDVIQSAGYYPDPVTYTPTQALPVSPHFAATVIPVITGTANASPPGDTITVRYASGNNAAGKPDQVINCLGQINGTGGLLSWENTFAVDSNHELTCAVWDSKSGTTGAAVPLVTGVQGMTLQYGLNTGTASGGTCVDTYKSSTNMAAADWANVCSVTVTLTFTNPVPPANGSKPTIQFSRVIAIMSQGGVNS